MPKKQSTAKKKRVRRPAKRAARSRAGTSKRATARRRAGPKLDLAEFRDLLTGERDRLLRELGEIEARTARRNKLDAAIEREDFDESAGDAAADTLERGTDMALERNVHDLLEQVELSLDKIESGTYGICDTCGEPIAERRLKALPYATLCLACRDLMERS